MDDKKKDRYKPMTGEEWWVKPFVVGLLILIVVWFVLNAVLTGGSDNYGRPHPTGPGLILPIAH